MLVVPKSFSYERKKNPPSSKIGVGLPTTTKKTKEESSMKLDTDSLAHKKWNCKYHIVFAPTYRRQVIYGKIKTDIGIMLRKLCEYKQVEISINTIDPTQTGKITIINFWGTWCTPCFAELPYFDQIANNYKDDVTVVAIHSSLSRETAPQFVKNTYPNSNIIFAADIPDKNDELNGEYYLHLGGSNTYPYTVIIDENGIIQEIFVKALHYEDLKDAVDAILE